MRFFIVLSLLAVLFCARPAFAASPFGLTIGEITEQEFKAKINARKSGVSTWTNGNLYEISPKDIEIEGLKGGLAIFSTDKVLVGLILDFHKHRFDDLNTYAAESYAAKSKSIPFVGDKRVTYVDGKTEIWLEARHMGFDMSMSFLDQSLIKAFEAGSKAKAQEKADQEQNVLFGK